MQSKSRAWSCMLEIENVAIVALAPSYRSVPTEFKHRKFVKAFDR